MSRAVQSLKLYNKPGNKEEMLSRTRSKDSRPATNSKNKKRSGASKSPKKYCSKTGEGHSRRASASDKHRARSGSRSRSPLLLTSSDGDAIPKFLLVIVHRELRNIHPVIQVDWGEQALL